MLPALDDWVAVRSKVKDESATRRLIDVLRTADPDPWRQRIRDCLTRKDWTALESLVKSPDLDRQPAATISFLCAALRHQSEADTERAVGVGDELGHRGFFLEIDVLQRAQLNYPADYWINRRLGVSLIWLKSPPLVQKGIGYLRAAVAIRPQEVEALMNLSQGYEFLGEYDQALAGYRKALEFAPQDASLHNSLAWLFATSEKAQLRDPGRAVQLAKRAVELASHNANCWNTLGVAKYRAGQWREAISTLDQSLQIAPANSAAYNYFFLAMAHSQLGHKEEAQKWYDKGVEWTKNLDPKNEELRRFQDEASRTLGIVEPNSSNGSINKDIKEKG